MRTLNKTRFSVTLVLIATITASVLVYSVLQNVGVSFPLKALAFAILSILSSLLGIAALNPIIRHLDKVHKEIRVMTHDIRTPLTIIKTETGIWLMENSNISQEEALEIMKNSSEAADKISMILEDFGKEHAKK